MAKEKTPNQTTDMAVLIEEGTKLELKNPRDANVIYEAAIDLANKVGEKKVLQK